MIHSLNLRGLIAAENIIMIWVGVLPCPASFPSILGFVWASDWVLFHCIFPGVSPHVVLSSLDAMPVLRSEAAQGANLSNCVETLSSLLENALTKGKADGDSLPGPHYSCLLPEPPLFAFSTALLRALLDDDSVISPNPGHLFSFINQHKDRIGLGLESISLKCLSIFLLRSSANDDCELALYLLMVWSPRLAIC